MHLVYKALENHAIPNVLPPELSTKSKSPVNTSVPNRGKDGMKPDLPPTVAIQSNVTHKPIQPVQPIVSWIVTPDEKAKSDALFVKSDIDKDGFVSGLEIKDVFLQSGVPQHVLAHIW